MSLLDPMSGIHSKRCVSGVHTDILLSDSMCEHQECACQDELLGDSVCEHHDCACPDV